MQRLDNLSLHWSESLGAFVPILDLLVCPFTLRHQLTKSSIKQIRFSFESRDLGNYWSDCRPHSGCVHYYSFSTMIRRPRSGYGRKWSYLMPQSRHKVAANSILEKLTRAQVRTKKSLLSFFSLPDTNSFHKRQRVFAVSPNSLPTNVACGERVEERH